jgi:deoxyxylulose-5-phosphate synthase
MCVCSGSRRASGFYSVGSASTPVGIDVTAWDAGGCAPVDTEILVDWEGHAAVVTIEDRISNGGMMIADRVRAIDPEIAVRVLGSRTRLIPHAGTPDEILSRFGLDPARVAETVKELGGAFLD